MMQALRCGLLAAGLLALWIVLGLSAGHLQLGLGVISAVAVTAFALYLGLVDAESVPLRVGARIGQFWLWLSKEIVVSATDVARRILDGPSHVSPTTATIVAGQRSDLMRVILANSITLTPATITLSVNEDQIFVHTLTDSAASDLAHGDMNRRVSNLWGRVA